MRLPEKIMTAYANWDQNTRLPNPAPPSGSCDCQAHLYGDEAVYPTRPNPPYPPIAHSGFADLQRMHRALGFQRAVFVQSSIYTTDHSVLLDTLESLGDRSNYRGIAVIDQNVTDAQLQRLNAAGFCGARFNFTKFLSLVPDAGTVMRTIDRVRELGWHIRLHVGRNDVLEHSELFLSIKNIAVVIDHLGHADTSLGPNQPAVQWMLDRIRHDGWWMMVSNGNRLSPMDSGWDDAVPIAKAFIEAAPERIVWSSDWPHPQWRKRMMNDAEEVELLYRYVDYDKALLQKILVDNPVRLHGFK
jgi:predicted TIM-barrel fold metal-dependent hydrolase